MVLLLLLLTVSLGYLAVAAVLLRTRATARRVGAQYAAMGYPLRSPAWTGMDGRRWYWDCARHREVAA